MATKEATTQNNMRKNILDFTKDIKRGNYFIEYIHIDFDVIGTGVDENGCIKNEDTGMRTLTIRYHDNTVKKIEGGL